jgi:hypothetical protein
VVADAPFGRARVQRFFSNGDNMGGFALPGRQATLVALDNLVISGVGSVIYTGQAVLVNQPENGALVTEYALDGQPLRTVGELRRTGHEQDRDLHLALNTGVIAPIPSGGGYYFVFVAGVPMFRKYDSAGTLVFERHIEGSEMDDYMRQRPTTWPRRRVDDGELPLVRPAIRAAAADANGLWISLDVPFTYVYDNRGDKIRVVQFRGVGIIAPTSLSVTSNGRILVTPGCYVFESRRSSGD